jgi:hypothetical protein
MSASETRQDCAPNPEAQNEHRWLQKLVGDWTYESEASMGPDQPPAVFRGSETVRSLGDVWTLGEGRGEMPGGAIGLTLMTLGFDVQKKRFVGTFVGSMMTNLWVYDGELDKDQKVLTLYADGPDFTSPEKTGKYKDLIEFKSEDHRTLSSHFQDENGAWHHFMTANYRRKK